ncbi:MAG: nuclear transport factor 2 family protein [Nostoc sp. DedQUE08]|uniref:nuclear transport factor 2 family protein n=1 Tax=unclassified Nostoc TaxID=2593658 RepID=UPI002AD4C78C|nr:MULTISPECIES: nuclear transport factor 2 family protein [unclassified Nostoc]MDZ8070307.1 nuclear transport factor 2 family protein [Nostoc sp. DedQUE08]MDZ8127328.1 nuclear transport factor 2 family protein [Nostoc sp. DedQUE07]
MLWLSQWLVLGTIFVSLTFSTPLVASQSMNQQDIQILIEKAKDAWVAQDIDAIAQLFTIDGELIVPGQCWRGQERIREGLANFKEQYSDVKIDIHRIIIGANQAAVEWYYEDTEKATGRRNKADDVIVVDFKDNQISRWREYFDTQTPTNK